jgi:hypothetical protein
VNGFKWQNRSHSTEPVPTTELQGPGHVLDTEAFDEHFVTDDMNSLHVEHSFPPVAEVRAQPYRTERAECSFSACQTVQYPISATTERVGRSIQVLGQRTARGGHRQGSQWLLVFGKARWAHAQHEPDIFCAGNIAILAT